MSSIELHICGHLDKNADTERYIYVVNPDTKVYSYFYDDELCCSLKDIITLINTFGIHHTDYHHSLDYSDKYKNQLESDGYVEINIE